MWRRIKHNLYRRRFSDRLPAKATLTDGGKRFELKFSYLKSENVFIFLNT